MSLALTIVAMIVWAVFFLVVGYSCGYREGERHGKAAARQIASDLLAKQTIDKLREAREAAWRAAVDQ